MEALGQNGLTSKEKRVIIINQDCFYKDISEEQKKLATRGEYNFDHPGTAILTHTHTHTHTHMPTIVWCLLYHKATVYQQQ